MAGRKPPQSWVLLHICDLRDRSGCTSLIEECVVIDFLGVAGAAATSLRDAEFDGHFAERRAAVRRADADLAIGDRIAEADEHGRDWDGGRCKPSVYRNSFLNAIDKCSHLCYILFMLTFSLATRSDRAGLTGLAAAVLAHVAILLFLLTYAPVREVLNTLAPLMVELIKSELPAPPVPKPESRIELPKPLPVRRLHPQSLPERPILAAQTQSPVAAETPAAPEPKPAPPVEARAAPPAPVIPASFNANYLDNPAPVYPSLSRRLGEQGKVLLRVFVEPDGLPSTVEVRTSSGSERLDQSALDAVRRWKFMPAKQGDRAVAAWVLVPILFNLRG